MASGLAVLERALERRFLIRFDDAHSSSVPWVLSELSVESPCGAFSSPFILTADGSSRNYNSSPHLGKIKAQALHINSADDVINPPELGIAEREIKKVRNGRFILLPTTDQTRGHGTHSRPVVWGHYLEELLKSMEE